jgi:hypothetical protein
MKTNALSLILISLITCFASLRPAEAVDPSPDGEYPRGNTAEGHNALFSLTNGIRNTALGASALFSNKSGDNNTATGFLALNRNTGGKQNTATGVLALADNEFGNSNTATGMQALEHNGDSSENTANGFNALQRNITGSFNTAIGFRAGASSTTGENNIYIGANMFGFPAESNHTYVRNVNITSVGGAGADTVTVDLGTGLIGHLSSSRRYKEDIKSRDTASEAVFSLRPVTYRYKKEIDASQSPAFGLIAEEVAQVNPDLVARNSKGQPESVHYEMVNAMLLNEFLKEHRGVQELEATVAQQGKDSEATAERQQKQIDALTAGLQKVSAQLEVSRPAPQTVLNDR